MKQKTTFCGSFFLVILYSNVLALRSVKDKTVPFIQPTNQPNLPVQFLFWTVRISSTDWNIFCIGRLKTAPVDPASSTLSPLRATDLPSVPSFRVCNQLWSAFLTARYLAPIHFNHRDLIVFNNIFRTKTRNYFSPFTSLLHSVSSQVC